MAEINDLPDELLEFIMSYLPQYKDFENLEVVCKRWKNLVENVKRHTYINFIKGLSEFRVSWKSKSPTEQEISGRFSHSALVHHSSHSMFVFGGRSSTSTTFNDLWSFDLSKRKWIRKLPTGNYPSPKACMSFVCYKDYLILFGGVRHPGLDPPYQMFKLFDELHVYSVLENHWTLYTPQLNPPLSAGHSASTRNNQMIVFGGYQKGPDSEGSSNDVWCLDLTTFCWHKQLTSKKKPPPRYGQFQITIDEDNLLILGGCGGPNNVFNDAWILNMKGSIWEWKSIAIKNKKWGSSSMWCYPACKVGSHLVVLGPTPNLPCDFQIVREQRYPPRRRDEQPNIGNSNPNIPRINPIIQDRNVNQNASNQNVDEATIRLKRNLQQLRNRDDEHLLPKRFNDHFINVQNDHIKMSAFCVHKNPNPLSRDLQSERLRRMEDKLCEIRRMYQESPSPKRMKRNCIAMFVCDLSNVLSSSEPTLDWIEYKNYGIVPGAPERLILSSLVNGKSEIIMFGGLFKESLSNDCSADVQVSNSVHFLTVPQGII